MKKIILAGTIVALLASQAPAARAGDRGVGIAAGVLGGLIVGTAIANAASHPVYYAPAPAYCPPPVVYAPAPPPVAYAPAAAYYYPPAVYYAPAPVVTLGFGYGFGGRAVYRAPHYVRGRW